MMLTNNQDLINSMGSVSISMAATFNMPAVYVYNQVICSIQLVFTGTPAGNFKIQISNDHKVTTDFLPVNWTDYTGSSQTVSAAGDIMYDITDIGFAWVRIVYTATGAGTAPKLTVARIVIKGV